MMLRRTLLPLCRDPLALLALAVLCLLLLTALLAPWLAPYPPDALTGEPLAPPGSEHWVGTDQLSRDVFSRLLHGARTSVRVAGLSVALALGLGTLIGVMAGYFGRWLDQLLSRSMDVMFALPEIILALVIMAILGPGLTSLTLAIAIVYTPIFARVCRSATIAVGHRPYVQAAEAVGAGHVRIMFHHILPGVVPVLLVQTSLSFAFAILAEAALSFLGLAGTADLASWGVMLREGYDNLYDPRHPWWLMIAPGLAISLSVLAFNILGDGLQHAWDPRRA